MIVRGSNPLSRALLYLAAVSVLAWIPRGLRGVIKKNVDSV